LPVGVNLFLKLPTFFMNKEEQYLAENPACDEIHATSDGNLFYSRSDAANHAKTLAVTTVETVRQEKKIPDNTAADTALLAATGEVVSDAEDATAADGEAVKAATGEVVNDGKDAAAADGEAVKAATGEAVNGEAAASTADGEAVKASKTATTAADGEAAAVPKSAKKPKAAKAG
jgi:hypothetical protein